jgi:hypothetical protein
MTDSYGVFHDVQTSIEAAFTELEQKNLCESWPVDRMHFESLTGKWKSSIIKLKSLPGVDSTMVNLAFDLLPTDSTCHGPAQRRLIPHLADFSFVTDELYPNRLNQAILDFLDSSLLLTEVRVAST